MIIMCFIVGPLDGINVAQSSLQTDFQPLTQKNSDTVKHQHLDVCPLIYSVHWNSLLVSFVLFSVDPIFIG